MDKITLSGLNRDQYEEAAESGEGDRVPDMFSAMLRAAYTAHDHDWDAYEFSTSDVAGLYPTLTVDCSCDIKFQIVF